MNLARFNQLLGRLDREGAYQDDSTPSLSDQIATAKTYVDGRTFRADLVAVLPPDAPPGYLMVKAGDINLYVGTGIGNPLRKIATTP